MRPALTLWGDKPPKNYAVEEIQYEKMEFNCDADANKFARKVLGHNCFAVQLDDNELRQHKQLSDQFSKTYLLTELKA